MINHEDIIREARSMIGTPWRHQGRVPGHGLDCIGLAICVLQRLGVEINDRNNYGRAPVPHEFIAAIREHVPEKSLDDLLPGDLVLMAPRKILQHAGIIVSLETMVHASNNQKVEEVGFAGWRSRFRYCFDLSAANV